MILSLFQEIINIKIKRKDSTILSLPPKYFNFDLFYGKIYYPPDRYIILYNVNDNERKFEIKILKKRGKKIVFFFSFLLFVGQRTCKLREQNRSRVNRGTLDK